MTLLEKIDAVLKWLYINSGTNPNFEDIRIGLLDKKIGGGEIRDCLLHLYRQHLIYCEHLGNRDSQYTDHPGAHYLISFKGKLFWETEGGFQEQANRERIRSDADEARTKKMEKNEEQLVTWTRNLADRTAELTLWTRYVAIGAMGLVFWEILVFFLERHHAF